MNLLTTDWTEYLNLLLATAAQNRELEVYLDSDADYPCESSVHLLDATDIIVQAEDAVIRRTKKARGKAVMSVHILRPRNVTVRNLHVIGKKDPDQGYVVSVEGHHGFGVFVGTDTAFEGCSVNHVPGDFLYVTGEGNKGPKKPPPRPSINTTWRNGFCADAGRHAVAGLNYSGLRIADSEFHRWRRARIDREDMTARAVHEGLVDTGNVWDKKGVL